MSSYAAAGVDVRAGDRAVELMRAAVAATHVDAPMPVLAGAGGFAGLVDASVLTRYRHPLLATSTDGVGTKVVVAREMGVHDTIGVDLVAMVVDDLVACGATPLFMTDYIACGHVVPEQVAAIVAGVAWGCRQAGCALVGGETAEHPGVMGPGEYDLAGAATGVVESDDLLGPHRVQDGDVLIALGSSGLHANGYSLVRRLLADAGWSWDRHVDELGRTIGEELLEPTRIYARAVLGLASALGAGLRAVAHVTGGGLSANLARVLPPGLVGVVDRSTWSPGPVFAVVADLGDVEAGELQRTLNMGVGMVVVVGRDRADRAVSLLGRSGVAAWVVGSVLRGNPETGDAVGTKGVDGGAARLVGTHPSTPTRASD